MPYGAETLVDNLYAVFRQDNGALKVREVSSTITYTSTLTERSKVFHIVEAYDGRFQAEQMGNFVAVFEIPIPDMRVGSKLDYLQYTIRTLLNEWII